MAMRWVLAGIAFSLMVALAVVTVAIKAQNVRYRAHVERLTFEEQAVFVEWARQAGWYRAKARERKLLDLLRQAVLPPLPVG